MVYILHGERECFLGLWNFIVRIIIHIYSFNSASDSEAACAPGEIRNRQILTGSQGINTVWTLEFNLFFIQRFI